VAQLEDCNPSATSASEIPATTQLLAIAWLRWRIFVNSFRRHSGPRKASGLVFAILLRVLLWPILALWVIGPAIGAGFFAWYAVSDGHPQRLTLLLAGITVFWQFLVINGTGIAATISSFDPASLLRFPLRFGRYLVLRLLLGLLTPSTIAGCLALLATLLGIAVADSSLVPAALVALAIYAAMNIFFSRMIAVWMERWLSTRRAREIFGVIMAILVVSIQFISYRRPVSHAHGHAPANSLMLNLLHGSDRILGWLPPGFVTHFILLAAHPLQRLVQLVALLAWTGLIFAALVVRLHKQFLGEYLSDGAPRSSHAPRKVPGQGEPRGSSRPAYDETPAGNLCKQPSALAFFSPTVATCLRKEWIYLRGNSNQIISMLTPLVFVVIFARRMLAGHPSFLLPAAVGYTLLGPLVTLYNVFGADGAGVHLYLLAPVRLRDVLLAKNIASLSLLLVEAVLTWCIILLIAGASIPLANQLSAAFWIVFILFANLVVGSVRSIQAPRKIALAQTRQMRTPAASRTSGLLVLATLLGSILLQFPVVYLSHHFHNPWLGFWCFAPLATAAVAAYALLLRRADRMILAHRDRIAEELCGA